MGRRIWLHIYFLQPTIEFAQLLNASSLLSSLLSSSSWCAEDIASEDWAISKSSGFFSSSSLWQWHDVNVDDDDLGVTLVLLLLWVRVCVTPLTIFLPTLENLIQRWSCWYLSICDDWWSIFYFLRWSVPLRMCPQRSWVRAGKCTLATFVPLCCFQMFP